MLARVPTFSKYGMEPPSWGHFLAAKSYFNYTKRWSKRSHYALRSVISNFKYINQKMQKKDCMSQAV